MRTESRLAEAQRWRAVERDLRSQGWSRSRAVAEVARRKRLEKLSPLARLWERICG